MEPLNEYKVRQITNMAGGSLYCAAHLITAMGIYEVLSTNSSSPGNIFVFLYSCTYMLHISTHTHNTHPHNIIEPIHCLYCTSFSFKYLLII